MATFKVTEKRTGVSEQIEAVSSKQALFKSALDKSKAKDKKQKKFEAGRLYAAMLKSHEAVQLNGSIQLDLFQL